MSSNLIVRTDHYVYQPLLPDKEQIRLIYLVKIPKRSSKSKQLPVECTMEVFDINKAPSYTALSYMWGPTAPVRDIFIDNQPFSVRQNLFDFLHHFRSMDTDPEHSSDMWLWIDQISIEQSNIDERSRQVQMMSVIYLAADSVIAWLGIGSRRPIGSKYNNPTVYALAKSYTKTKRPDDLEPILRSKYFCRLWIVQEFLLADCIRVLVKDIWILGKSDGLFGIIGNCRNSVSSRVDERLNNLFMNRRHPVWSPHPSWDGRLEDAIALYSEGICQDPRDRVYGLLGLVRLAE
jgi:hypothetical protein